MVELSPRLALESPDAFKRELIDGLPKRSVLGKQLWQSVERSGLITTDSLHIDPTTWVSRSNSQHGYAHVGTKPFDADERARLLFHDTEIDYSQEATLRLLHETGHLFEASRIRARSNRIEELLRTTREIRSVNQNLGLTAIGSNPFYGPDMKFHEDAAELMAMYALDPEYLSDFMGYVDNPNNAEMLSSAGITVVPGYGDELFKLVEDTVQEGIRA